MAEHVWADVEDPATFGNYNAEQVGRWSRDPISWWRPRWSEKSGMCGRMVGLQDRFPGIAGRRTPDPSPGMNEITMAQMCITNDIDMAFSMTPSNMKLIQSQNDKFMTHFRSRPLASRTGGRWLWLELFGHAL